MTYRYSNKSDRWVKDADLYLDKDFDTRGGWIPVESFPHSKAVGAREDTKLATYVEVWEHEDGRILVDVEAPYCQLKQFLCRDVIEMFKVFHLISPYISLVIADEVRNNG